MTGEAKKKIFSFLQEYSYDPLVINRLIVSAFLYSNEKQNCNNKLIRPYLIRQTDKDFKSLQAFLGICSFTEVEDLIQIFEFVISPHERVVSGAVYTPSHIREYIIDTCVVAKNKNLRLADIACGCGGFLIDAAKKIHQLTNKKFVNIFEENIWGLDIASYSVERCRITLTLFAIQNGEEGEINFNLFVGDALEFEWAYNCAEIKKNGGFDVIVGNPPYVCSRNIGESTKALLRDWSVAQSGHPDLYIPFFQIALENLKEGGVLGYITVNTFFKSINGRSIRSYFSENRFSIRIIDFKDEQVFKKRNTYTCICIIEKRRREYIEYTIATSQMLSAPSAFSFEKHDYVQLNDWQGWNLTSFSAVKSIIVKLEASDDKLFLNFSFSTGIATLKNDIFIFKSIRQDASFFYLEDDNFEYPIEKKICREVINANKVTDEISLDKLKKKIIFPYYWNKQELKYKSITGVEFQETYPCAYYYLNSKRALLELRDKGKGKYEKWFSFGRAQGLNIKGYKLFLPHIAKEPRFVLSDEQKLLFCNGEAIISNDKRELEILRKILQTRIFWFYIKHTSKPYSSGYWSLGRNYLKDFSIPKLTDSEKTRLLLMESIDDVETFLAPKYNLSRGELLSMK